MPNTYLDTWEYWEQERETVKYNALCADARRRDSRIEIELRYAAVKNRELRGRNDAWGQCALIVDLADLRAKARWTDLNFSEYNGIGRCSVLEDELLEEYTHEQISRLSRPKQSAIRLQLLQMYGRCALTGETTRAVLDAVHIIEAAKNGANTRSNCFLLRSDLHRLFDRGMLTFTPSGAAVFAGGVSDRYVTDFSGRALAADVLENVSDSLARRFGTVAA